MTNWKLKPTPIYMIPMDITYSVFLDENGSAETKSIYKAIHNFQTPSDPFFNVAAVIIHNHDYTSIKKRFNDLKNEFWEQGCFPDKHGKSKKVCLHTKDINNKHGAFDTKVINHDLLVKRLTEEIAASNFTILDAFINKFTHLRKYSYPEEPYSLSLRFILERLSTSVLKDSDTAILILESRGKNEDRELLANIVKILETGTKYATKGQLNKIKGVYFNPKRSKINDDSPFIGLELADLCAYPIYKYCKYNTKDNNFITLQNKLAGFPYNLYGIKKFP